MLMVGLVGLATATFAIVGYLPPFPNFDPRWLLAGGAALVGLLLLIVSVRGPHESRDS
jgi:amino acid transporter